MNRHLVGLLIVFALTAIAVEAKKKSKAGAAEKKKSWREMTDADWNKWEYDSGKEDDDRPQEPKPMKFDPSNMQNFMRQSKAGKAAMIFSNLKGKLSKEKTEEVAFRWKNLLMTVGVEASPYVIENSQILWTVMNGAKGFDILDFAMQQPETELVEWENTKYYPETYKKGEL
jgi:hypothetical protein